jgi:hypothetical protein
VLCRGFLVFILCFGFGIDSLSQSILTIDSLKDNKEGIAIDNFKSWTKNNGVLYFCSNDYSLSQYKKQLEFFEISKIDTVNPPYLKLLLFNEYDQISKNPFLINSGFKDSTISQIECFVICTKKENVDRAIKIYEQNFFIKDSFENEGIYQIAIRGICPRDLTFSISVYYDLIYEIFNPHYSMEERLLFQEDKINQLLQEIEQLKDSILKLEKNQNESIEDIIDRIEYLESTKKRSNG